MDERPEIYVPPGGPPPLPPLSPEIYQSMGEAGVFQMMEAFYSRLGRSRIRSMFGEDLIAASQRAAAFYVQLLGGPQMYNDRYGNPMMRRRHLPFIIDEASRKVWLGCFYRTLDESARYNFPPEHLPDFRIWLDGFSNWMVNSKKESEEKGTG